MIIILYYLAKIPLIFFFFGISGVRIPNSYATIKTSTIQLSITYFILPFNKKKFKK